MRKISKAPKGNPLLAQCSYKIKKFIVLKVKGFDVKDNGYSLFHGKIGKLILSADTQTIPNV